MFDEAQLLLHRMIDEKLLTAHGVVTLLPAQSDGDDILVYDKDGGEATAVLHGLRQQVGIIVVLLLFLQFICPCACRPRRKRMVPTFACQTLWLQSRVG